jgi:hypothetical protein
MDRDEMTDSPDHRAEVFSLAQARHRAGRPVWKYTVQLAPVFHDETLTFEERRDQIVGILRRSQWFKSREDGGAVHEYVDALADADDVDEFDAYWDELYDEADYDRAWLVTR